MIFEISLTHILIICMIIISGSILIYLQIPKTQEHFPRFTEKLHEKPKLLLPMLADDMREKVRTKSYSTLPDDYQYLYDYEKNFEISKVYGDFASRLEAYKAFLMENKNTFHNLSEKDIDNLAKLLNNINLSDQDIPNNFVYKKDFTASNN